MGVECMTGSLVDQIIRYLRAAGFDLKRSAKDLGEVEYLKSAGAQDLGFSVPDFQGLNDLGIKSSAQRQGPGQGRVPRV